MKDFYSIEDSCRNELVAGVKNEMGKFLNKGEYIYIAVNNPLLSILLFEASWLKGVTPVPINPGSTIPEITSMLGKVHSRYLITDFDFEVPSGIDRISVTDLFNNVLRNPISESVNAPDLHIPTYQGEACILFTSGTTGCAKAVSLNFRFLNYAFQRAAKCFHFVSNESTILSLPLFHIGGFSIWFRAMLANQQLFIPASLKADSINQIIDCCPVGYLSVVPTQLNMGQFNLDSLKKIKAILVGGAKLSPEIYNEYLKNEVRLYKVYGATETAAFCCVLTPDEGKLNPQAAGNPLDGVEIRILNSTLYSSDNRQTVGEIGIQLQDMPGEYLNDPGASAQNYKNGYFLPGDIGYLNPEGFLFIHARIDDLINSGGEKIFPDEIEMVLNRLNGVVDSTVLGIPDSKWGEAVVAVLQISDDFRIESLNEGMGKFLSKYKIPKKLFLTREPIFNTLGKKNRSDLRAKILSGLFSEYIPR
ncbi:MAG: acyl--CoA ligase [Ignavibacteria bacterium]|nr:acyl--CoA ligase [Ignavibacteria bacterium]